MHESGSARQPFTPPSLVMPTVRRPAKHPSQTRIGAFYIVRCSECRHLTFSSANRNQASCPHCRHPVLTHPIHAIAHRDSRADVRVPGDRLRY